MTLKEDAEVSIESFTRRGWQTLGRGLRLAEGAAGCAGA